MLGFGDTEVNIEDVGMQLIVRILSGGIGGLLMCKRRIVILPKVDVDVFAT